MTTNSRLVEHLRHESRCGGHQPLLNALLLDAANELDRLQMLLEQLQDETKRLDEVSETLRCGHAVAGHMDVVRRYAAGRGSVLDVKVSAWALVSSGALQR